MKKKCSKCGIEKELNKENFEPRTKSRDGFRNQCKDCRNERRRVIYAPKSDQSRKIETSQNKNYKSNRWTDEEKDILRKYYPYLSAKEINDKYLPNRTPEKIMDYATKKLNLHKDKDTFHSRWNQDQLSYLSKNYCNPNVSIDEMSDVIGKSNDTIRAMAKSIGLYRVKESIFSNNEKEIIEKYYPVMRTLDLQNQFIKDKTIGQITKYANENNIFKNEDILYHIRRDTGINNLQLIPDQSRENSPRWKERLIVECSYCGNGIEKSKEKISKSKNHFCNYTCMGMWMSDNLQGKNNPNYDNGDAWTEEMRQNNAKRAVGRLLESDFKISTTKPERIIEDILNNMGIKHQPEYDCNYYLVDKFLTDFNLMIEVQGNFFHCNPTMKLNNKRKNKIIHKDKSKHTYISRYYNIEILYLWEKDINDNPLLCEKLIRLYIEKNGMLENYHSFNYENDKNGIKLKDNILEFEY